MQAVGLGGMVATAYKLFGTWRKAIEAAGVDAPVTRERKWPLERILAEIRRMAREGLDVSFGAVHRLQPRLVEAAYRHPALGNWRKALEMAGLDPTEHQQRQQRSRQSIIEAIQAMADRGESLGFGAARGRWPRLVAAACSRQHFGSWAKAVQAAGFDYEAHRQRQRWTRERILATIKHLHADEHPLTGAWLKRTGWGALVAAARRPSMFGSWRDAVECAGIDYESVRQAGLAATRELRENEGIASEADAT